MDLTALISGDATVQPRPDFDTADYFVHNRTSTSEVTDLETHVRRLRVVSEATVRNGVSIKE